MDESKLKRQAQQAITELLRVAGLKPADIVVVGCSSSEIGGEAIGSHSSTEIAEAILQGIYPIIEQQGLYLAAQCCEHLNRALIIEQGALLRYGLEEVNVVPQPKAGGSFATAAYAAFSHPVAVENVKARAGLDIGDTLIGMHLAAVAVPIRLPFRKIGEANLVAARSRPKFIGGARAHYNENKL